MPDDHPEPILPTRAVTRTYQRAAAVAEEEQIEAVGDEALWNSGGFAVPVGVAGFFIMGAAFAAGGGATALSMGLALVMSVALPGSIMFADRMRARAALRARLVRSRNREESE